MSKNKNNQPIWGVRIKKNSTNLFTKVGASLSVDKRLFNEDIESSKYHQSEKSLLRDLSPKTKA